MAEQVEGFTFFRSYLDAVVEMEDTVKLEVLTAIVSYGLNGVEPTLSSPISRAIFSIAKPNLDSSRDSVISGKKGGRPKQKPPFSENEPPPFRNSKTNKNKELELEEEKKKKDIGADKPPKHPRFVPPTLEEVTSYIQERGSRVDPQGFIDFYASKGWMIGKTPMKDWKAACRNAENWERWDKVQTASGNIFLDIAREEGIL